LTKYDFSDLPSTLLFSFLRTYSLENMWKRSCQKHLITKELKQLQFKKKKTK